MRFENRRANRSDVIRDMEKEMKPNKKCQQKEQHEQKAESLIETNPICDVMSSKHRQQLVLSPKDMEILRQMAQNPPSPTHELVNTLRQNTKKKATGR